MIMIDDYNAPTNLANLRPFPFSTCQFINESFFYCTGKLMMLEAKTKLENFSDILGLIFLVKFHIYPVKTSKLRISAKNS
jgi:hypothetical protein